MEPTSLSLLTVGTLSTLLAEPNDNYLQEQWHDYQEMDRKTAKLGDDIAQYGIGPAIALTQYYFDSENGASHIRALIYVTVIGSAMKAGFQRERPNHSNKHSFPSGHTYSAFATATSLTYAYGWKAGIIAYPVAAMIGLGRMADNYHWFSDVVAGAFLGAWAAHITFYPKVEESTVTWTPIFTAKSQGIQFYKSF